MRRLADLQADFAAALNDPALPAPADVRRQVKLPQSRRFDVYRNNMMVSLIEVLEATFPVVQRLVGSDFFKAAAKVYIRQAPPRSPVLLLYGETFGDFLDGFEPAAGVPYLGDVARLEWARVNAYHAADAEPLTIEHLAAVPQAQLAQTHFTLHPSLRLVSSRFPVASLWAATSGADPQAEVDMKRGEDAAVLRPMLAVDLRLLPPGGHAFMAALAGGHPLGEAADLAARAVEDFDLACHLQGLFQLGAVAALQPPEPIQEQA
ncbi:HvfC/BufC N-terminal domain-containing protein [Pelagibius marinus]|uniref:HvfC/BufC N-terminal domain-containing protein n=1 Tax=Pelagibius marinus TaxID=2762760 RepID=UPI001872EE05|nr:DNA-binding domain-containing protein [Pelagibius marinus]